MQVEVVEEDAVMVQVEVNQTVKQELLQMKETQQTRMVSLEHQWHKLQLLSGLVEMAVQVVMVVQVVQVLLWPHRMR